MQRPDQTVNLISGAVVKNGESCGLGCIRGLFLTVHPRATTKIVLQRSRWSGARKTRKAAFQMMGKQETAKHPNSVRTEAQ
jgi:hypothetical protein